MSVEPKKYKTKNQTKFASMWHDLHSAERLPNSDGIWPDVELLVKSRYPIIEQGSQHEKKVDASNKCCG